MPRLPCDLAVSELLDDSIALARPSLRLATNS